MRDEEENLTLSKSINEGIWGVKLKKRQCSQWTRVLCVLKVGIKDIF